MGLRGYLRDSLDIQLEEVSSDLGGQIISKRPKVHLLLYSEKDIEDEAAELLVPEDPEYVDRQY